MRTVLQSVRLLALVIWVGGLAFFAFVLAPLAFSRLPDPHLAGLVVGSTLRVLHWMGLACGASFVLATALRGDRSRVLEIALAASMLGATAYSQFHILPLMERDRTLAGGDIESAPESNSGRRDFERLHAISEKLEGLIFLTGLGLVFSMSREPNTPRTISHREDR